MLAWEDSFLGGQDKDKIKQLNLSIIETKENIVGVAESAKNAGTNIVENFNEAVTEVGNAGKTVVKELSEVSVSAAYNTAKANVELQKSAELAAARQGLIFETFDRQAEKLRQIRDDETKSITERKKANDELLVKISEAEESMLSQAKMQLNLANQNLQKDKDNIEFKTAQIEAEKELAGVRAQIEGIRSEQMSNANALDRESLELINAKTESESNLSIAKKKFAAEQILNEQLRLEKLIKINEQEKIIEEERLQSIIDLANGGTQAKIDAQIALDEFTNTNNEENFTLKADLAKKESELDRQKIKDKASVVDALSQFASAESGIGKALLIVKQGLALQETLMDLKRITFKGAEAIGAAGVATGQNVAESSKIGFPQNLITIAGAIAQGVGIVKSVRSAVSKTKASAGGAGASVPNIPTPSIPSIPSLPPSFNVVGASDTNQLASAIGGQSQEPVKAYVVSGDVTSAQSMDRNIVEGASI